MLLPILFLFATLAAASPSLALCPYNRFGQYYIVYVPNRQKSDQAQQQFIGMPYELYPTACAEYEMRPANITSDIVPDLVSLIYECQPTVPAGLKQIQPPIPGAWFNSYEGLPTARDCNALSFAGLVLSSDFNCETSSLLALCEVPIDAVEVITSTTTANSTVTEDVTSLLTTVFLSTETITDYFVTRITTVITRGTSTLTTLTTTSTSCSTITRIYTSTCCHDHHHHSRSCKPCKTTTTSTTTRLITPTCSNSSSNSNCCRPNHHGHRDHHRRGCRDCEAKNQEDVGNWKSTKLVKVPAAPNNARQSYIRCTDSLNGFYLVRENGGSGGDNKIAHALNINGVAACDFFSFNLANITIAILDNLVTLFDSCLTNFDTVVYNSYYGYTPLCGVYNYGLFDAVALSDVDATECNEAQWALCYSGSPLVTTSTVTTGPFSTNTINIIRTETATFTETVLTTETIIESEVLTVTNTSYLSLTLSTSTTVPTTTVTRTSISVTSCCCNPVVCTTIEECCKPKPTCNKPNRRHHH